MIGRLCKVFGVDYAEDPDQTYVLTLDNVLKMMAIHMRFRYGLIMFVCTISPPMAALCVHVILFHHISFCCICIKNSYQMLVECSFGCLKYNFLNCNQICVIDHLNVFCTIQKVHFYYSPLCLLYIYKY